MFSVSDMRICRAGRCDRQASGAEILGPFAVSIIASCLLLAADVNRAASGTGLER